MSAIDLLIEYLIGTPSLIIIASRIPIMDIGSWGYQIKSYPVKKSAAWKSLFHCLQSVEVVPTHVYRCLSENPPS